MFLDTLSLTDQSDHLFNPTCFLTNQKPRNRTDTNHKWDYDIWSCNNPTLIHKGVDVISEQSTIKFLTNFSKFKFNSNHVILDSVT